jgi:hypothetical protein
MIQGWSGPRAKWRIANRRINLGVLKSSQTWASPLLQLASTLDQNHTHRFMSGFLGWVPGWLAGFVGNIVLRLKYPGMSQSLPCLVQVTLGTDCRRITCVVGRNQDR